eukprot:Nk52_evm17s2426 gene=Nk52_evmTU17s2426
MVQKEWLSPLREAFHFPAELPLYQRDFKDGSTESAGWAFKKKLLEYTWRKNPWFWRNMQLALDYLLLYVIKVPTTGTGAGDDQDKVHSKGKKKESSSSSFSSSVLAERDAKVLLYILGELFVVIREQGRREVDPNGCPRYYRHKAVMEEWVSRAEPSHVTEELPSQGEIRNAWMVEFSSVDFLHGFLMGPGRERWEMAKRQVGMLLRWEMKKYPGGFNKEIEEEKGEKKFVVIEELKKKNPQSAQRRGRRRKRDGLNRRGLKSKVERDQALKTLNTNRHDMGRIIELFGNPNQLPNSTISSSAGTTSSGTLPFARNLVQAIDQMMDIGKGGAAGADSVFISDYKKVLYALMLLRSYAGVLVNLIHISVQEETDQVSQLYGDKEWQIWSVEGGEEVKEKADQWEKYWKEKHHWIPEMKRYAQFEAYYLKLESGLEAFLREYFPLVLPEDGFSGGLHGSWDQEIREFDSYVDGYIKKKMGQRIDYFQANMFENLGKLLEQYDPGKGGGTGGDLGGGNKEENEEKKLLWINPQEVERIRSDPHYVPSL